MMVDAVLHLERAGRISMEERMSEDLSAIISFFPQDFTRDSCRDSCRDFTSQLELTRGSVPVRRE